jgi:hypothetical protein
LDQFGISINSHMRKVEGRVLDPPPIQYQVWFYLSPFVY